MNSSIYDIPLTTIDGRPASLREHQGEVLLLVNVASQCGLTPQYAALEKLHERYRDSKFAVLGFPANDFAGQEPGSDEAIASFCRSTFGVEFPMYSKIAVTGEERHPLYTALTAERPETEDRAGMEAMLRGHGIAPTPAPEVLWNFEKFLIARDGRVVRRFSPDTLPDAARVLAAIDAEIEKN
jgi:glutathione peroxidase